MSAHTCPYVFAYPHAWMCVHVHARERGEGERVRATETEADGLRNLPERRNLFSSELSFAGFFPFTWP